MRLVSAFVSMRCSIVSPAGPLRTCCQEDARAALSDASRLSEIPVGIESVRGENVTA
jgi:hypothetical protein